MKNSMTATRRAFLKRSAASAFAFTIVPRHVLGGEGQTPPSEKITLAGIGVGTVQVIQHGDRWPDTRAVARLEVALDTALWPGTSTEPDARAGSPSVMATMIANGPDTPVATN